MDSGLDVLGLNDVHIWFGRPAELRLARSSLAAVLSAEESMRASRFRLEQDRLLFVAAHGLLRVLLGRYLERSPREIAIHTTPTGKPELVHTPGAQDIRFSLSHTRDGLMLGFAQQVPVGVDIENTEREVEIESLKDRVLRDEESECLVALSEEERRVQFFRYWTKKEAYLKAKGVGLRGDMRSFRFVPRGSLPFYFVIEDGGANHDDETWTVSQVVEEPGLVAAIAVACGEPNILRRSIGDIR